MRAVLYSRVSTEEQAVSGLGLAAQLERMRSAAASRGWEVVVELADEGVSGRIAPAKRPGLAQAIDLMCTHKADVLVVAKLDRLTRTTAHLLELFDEAERCRFAVVALDSDVDTTTPSGRMVSTMLGAVAEWERRVIGERTKAALAVKKAQGHRLGRPVRLDGAVRARVADLRASGLSIAGVAAQLNVEGVTQGNGAGWTRSAVQRVLRSVELDHQAAAVTA